MKMGGLGGSAVLSLGTIHRSFSGGREYLCAFSGSEMCCTTTHMLVEIGSLRCLASFVRVNVPILTMKACRGRIEV